MNATATWQRLAPLRERFDALAVRERGLIFAALAAVIFFAWQSQLMDRLTARGKAAEQRLDQARHQLGVIEQAGASIGSDPLVVAAGRNRALHERLAAQDRELQSLSQGYIAPGRMALMLRALLQRQRGLSLVSLRNLPVQSLGRGGQIDGDPAPAQDGDQGPFLHPVEMEVEGSYADLVTYLHAIERLPWRVYWQRLDLDAGEWPNNRIRIVVGALSLSRDWISV